MRNSLRPRCHALTESMLEVIDLVTPPKSMSEAIDLVMPTKPRARRSALPSPAAAAESLTKRHASSLEVDCCVRKPRKRRKPWKRLVCPPTPPDDSDDDYGWLDDEWRAVTVHLQSTAARTVSFDDDASTEEESSFSTADGSTKEEESSFGFATAGASTKEEESSFGFATAGASTKEEESSFATAYESTSTKEESSFATASASTKEESSFFSKSNSDSPQLYPNGEWLSCIVPQEHDSGVLTAYALLFYTFLSSASITSHVAGLNNVTHVDKLLPLKVSVLRF